MLPSFKKRFVTVGKNGLGINFLWDSKGRFPVSFSIVNVLFVSVARMDNKFYKYS